MIGTVAGLWLRVYWRQIVAFFALLALVFAIYSAVKSVYDHIYERGASVTEAAYTEAILQTSRLAESQADAAAEAMRESVRAEVARMYDAQINQQQQIKELDSEVSAYVAKQPAACSCLDADGVQLFNRLAASSAR